MSQKIGILALQGGVSEHLDHLNSIGIEPVVVRKVEHMDDIAGLIIPGGESTCLSRLLKIFEFDKAITDAVKNKGLKIWGTCAGAILVAGKIVGEDAHLQLIDMEVKRNAYGSQLDSFTTEAMVPAVSAEPVPLVFIRAPLITAVGDNVKVLLEVDHGITAVESADIIATTFHPELTNSTAFHAYFAKKCGLNPVDTKNENWSGTTWTQYAAVACKGTE